MEEEEIEFISSAEVELFSRFLYEYFITSIRDLFNCGRKFARIERVEPLG